MKLSVSPPPYEGAPVVVFISGLGGSGSYWLPQLAALEPEYQVVCYDQRGTGNNPATLPEGYSLAQMADELAQALAEAGIVRYSVVGHALWALVGLQLAARHPQHDSSVGWGDAGGNADSLYFAALFEPCRFFVGKPDFGLSGDGLDYGMDD